MRVSGCDGVLHERLSRRNFFRGSAAVAVAGSVAPREAAALTPDPPAYKPDWAVQADQLTTFAEDGYNTRRYTIV